MLGVYIIVIVTYYLVDKNYKEQTKKITINYINLTNIYKKKDSFTNKEIQKFVEENKDKLNDKLINFKYTKINPQNLLGLNDFNNLFFEKIDEIENDVLNGVSYEEIIKKYNLESSIKKNFKINDYDSNKFYKKIYENGKINKIELLDENDFYVLYEIIKTQKKLINVFVPTTPNPTSGFLLMFPIEYVIYLNMSFEEASKFIVSAGTSSKKT